MKNRSQYFLKSFLKSFEATDEQQIICDFEGFYNSSTLTYTFVDRAIHSVSSSRGKFSHNDRGLKGIQDFFWNHQCNSLCGLLGLPRNVLSHAECSAELGPTSPTSVSAVGATEKRKDTITY